MKKVFVLRPHEDWIVDRLVTEWYEGNQDISTDNLNDCDVIWLLASWCYKHISSSKLASKKVITTVHHIDKDKFDNNKLLEFQERDNITDVYHVPNIHTENIVKKLTKKPISVIPYWANQNIWYKTHKKNDLRKKYNLAVNSYLIGSFQRDTEGKDLITPKLEKGPDLFCDAIENWWKENKNLHVVLSGWRRQYVISRLTSKGIPFTYFEKPNQQILNELYQTLDLYPVTSRCEGGPQALIECGLLNIPVISRDIGMARQVLPSTAISNNVDLAVPCIPNVEDLKLPKGFDQYRKLMERL